MIVVYFNSSINWYYSTELGITCDVMFMRLLMEFTGQEVTLLKNGTR